MDWVKQLERDANRAADRAAWRATVIGLIALAVTIAMAGPSRAQDRGAWFKSLKMPGGTSCCDISDCKRVEAQWRGGGWLALSNVTKKWTQIPPARVLQSPHSIDGEAYLCEGPASGTIYCFVPPSPGS
jgi:hypothetical protein